MSYRKACYAICAISLSLAACLWGQQKKNPGYTDTPRVNRGTCTIPTGRIPTR